MDLSSMAQKPCENCGKMGHNKKTCWAPGGGAHKPGQSSQDWNPFGSPGKGKGKGKGKGAGKGKGKGGPSGKGKGKGKGKGGKGKGKGKGGKSKGKGHYHYDSSADYYWIGDEGDDGYYEDDGWSEWYGSDWGSQEQEPECEACENVFFSLNAFGRGRGKSEKTVTHDARQSNASSRATAGGSEGKVGGRPPADPKVKPVSADFGPLLWSGCEASEATSPKKGRYVKMIFDSGAGCTAMPASVGEGYPIA